jgi:hypothetical protein
MRYLQFKKIWLFVLSDNDKTAAKEARKQKKLSFSRPSFRRLRRRAEVCMTHESLNKHRECRLFQALYKTSSLPPPSPSPSRC